MFTWVLPAWTVAPGACRAGAVAVVALLGAAMLPRCFKRPWLPDMLTRSTSAGNVQREEEMENNLHIAEVSTASGEKEGKAAV